MRLEPLALICVGFDLIFVQASASDDINPGKLEFDNGWFKISIKLVNSNLIENLIQKPFYYIEYE